MAGPIRRNRAHRLLNRVSLAINSIHLMRSALLVPLCGLVAGLFVSNAACNRSSERSLTIAVNAGVEGTALLTAAREWGSAHGVRVQVVELPYANLFEKEQLDLGSRTGAYDVIMIDDPWFPRMAENGNLAQLPRPPDPDFVQSCVNVCRNPYLVFSGPAFALPYV